MKNLLLTGLFVSAAAATSFAAEPTVKSLTSEEYLNSYYGMNVLGMSANGRYVAGFTNMAPGCSFLCDTQTDKAVGFTNMPLIDDSNQLTGISDDGVAVGYDANGAVKAYMDGSYVSLDNGGYSISEAFDISADGSVAVGYACNADWLFKPCWWDKDNTFHPLPFPGTEEVKTFNVNGCQALYVSHDGGIIVGQLQAYPKTEPLIFWVRQADGSYEYVNVLNDLYEPLHENVYHEDTGEYTFETGPNPWMLLKPARLTNDGKTIVLYLKDNYSPLLNPPSQLGYYDIATGKITAEPYNDRSLLAEGMNITGVTDNLTVVGINADDVTKIGVPFVKKYGEDAVSLFSLYGGFEVIQEAEAWYKDGYPAVLSGISVDGRYMAGYYTETVETTLNQGLIYPAFFIDNGEAEPGAVGRVEAAPEGDAEYFTLDGLKVARPDKGIYIERRGGQTRKIIF